MFNHIVIGLTIWVRIYVLTSRYVQCNVLVEIFDPKPFLLVLIHTDALKTYTILIMQDLILLMVFHCRKVVEHMAPLTSRNLRDTEKHFVHIHLMTWILSNKWASSIHKIFLSGRTKNPGIIGSCCTVILGFASINKELHAANIGIFWLDCGLMDFKMNQVS